MMIVGRGSQSPFGVAACRRLFSAVLATVILSSAGVAAAAELEGFGPIKFGMTKEEAWEAIGREGEWISDDTLKYALSIPGTVNKDRFEVFQQFRNGRASDVRLLYEEPMVILICIPKGLKFAGAIAAKYSVEPTLIQGNPRQLSNPAKKPDHVVEDFYIFSFENNASIQISLTNSVERGNCRIVISYTAPSARINPF